MGAEPSFLIIGAAKSGTTTLFNALGDHPDVFLSPVKETNYFAIDPARPPRPHNPNFPVRTFEAYRALFAAGAGSLARGEASPRYMEQPETAERVARELPGVRLIAILRDPVDRAYSDYRMWLRLGGRRLQPETDFAADARWLKPESPFVRRGRYADALRPWRDRFPPERIRIALFDDLVSDAVGLLRDLYAFLGVDPSFRSPQPAHYNPGGAPRSRLLFRALRAAGVAPLLRRRFPALRGFLRRAQNVAIAPPPALPEGVRERLAAAFADDVAQLATLLGRDLSAWTRAAPPVARA